MTNNEVLRIKNTGGGNCFFKCISQFFMNEETFHIYYRKIVCELINSKKEVDKLNYPYILSNNNTVLEYIDNFNTIIKTGSYVGQYEIINTCIKLKCNIAIYNLSSNYLDYDNYHYIYETIISYNESFNPFSPLILIGWVNQNHYEILFPKQLNNEDYPLEFYTLNDNFEKSPEKKINKHNIDIKNTGNIELENNKQKENLSEEYKKILTTFIKNDKSIYPPLKCSKYGDTKLEDIKNFLLSSQNYNKYKNKSKIWPKYIIEGENNNKKILEKDSLKNKEGNKVDKSYIDKTTVNNNKEKTSDIKDIKLVNIKNLKSDFRKACKKYFIDIYNNLYYKKISKYKNKENKIKSKEEIFLVPTTDDLNQLLYKYHTSSLHSNYKELKAIFYKATIGFLGLDTIIQEYIKNCPICVQTGRTIHRMDPIHPIIVEGPDIRYQFNLTYLNDDMQLAFGIKYLLTIMDVFSRKAMIYGIKSKESKMIITYIIDFCSNHNIPKEFSSDNGAEFKNKFFDDYCQMNNIKLYTECLLMLVPKAQ